jgi:phosphinothricin acetyltransferase
MTSPLAIRHAHIDDLPAITDIYNEAITTTTATFDLETKDLDDRRRWFASHDSQHPVLVAETEHRVVGWVCLSHWSERKAYDCTAEVTFYVHREFRGQGVGRQLLTAIIAEATKLGYHSLLARVTQDSLASLHLCRHAGFTMVGTMREVGVKFGRQLDVHLLQMML